MLRKYFKEIGREDLPAGPKPVLREAAQNKLIDDVESWFKFLDARNMASNVYDEIEAQNVYEQIKQFPPFVKKLLIQLDQRL